MDAGGGADEIDDGVHGTHLVEVDRLNGDAVKLGFGLGDPLEHAMGGVAHLRGEFGFFQKITDFRPVAAVMVIMVVMMMVVVAEFLDEKAGAGQTTADGALGLKRDLFRQVKASNSFLKEGEGHARIEEGGTEHVAADPGWAVEMEVGCRHPLKILKKRAEIEGC